MNQKEKKYKSDLLCLQVVMNVTFHGVGLLKSLSLNLVFPSCVPALQWSFG